MPPSAIAFSCVSRGALSYAERAASADEERSRHYGDTADDVTILMLERDSDEARYAAPLIAPPPPRRYDATADATPMAITFIYDDDAEKMPPFCARDSHVVYADDSRAVIDTPRLIRLRAMTP